MQTDRLTTTNSKNIKYVHVDWKEMYKDEIAELLAQQREQVLEEVIRKIARAFPVKKEGDIGLMVLKNEGELKPSTSLGLIE